MRELTYCDAINEALRQEMRSDPRIFVYGIGVPDHKKIFGSTAHLQEEFGPERCFDTPLSEDAMSGLGIGAAISGMKPVHIHMRMDFMLLALNQIANVASSLSYSVGGKVQVPFVIRAIIGRGWGQGFQHSKTLQSILGHFPGLKVVMPTTPRDAKGLMIAALRDGNPVIVIEHRWLYYQVGDVPEESYVTPIGTSQVLRPGKDVTVVATSWMNVEALSAAKYLEKLGVSVEIIDARGVSPMDDSEIIKSVKKTGRCVVADNGWVHCGLSAEIAARVSAGCFGDLKAPVERIGFAATPCPTSRDLENIFYPNAGQIIRSIEKLLGRPPSDLAGVEFFSYEKKFKGPF